MLVKTAVCENAIMCQKCSRYHAPNVDCAKVFTISSDENVQSINKNLIDVTHSGAKGADDE